MHRFLCNVTHSLVLAVVLAVPVIAVPQEASPTMPVGEVSRGQRGYGLSVFAGSEPERFEVEVLGVMRDSGPGQSFILARLSGQGLEESGVIAGMSGSPVYIDDRLIGAVAFSWPFSNGAVGGITPIDAMLALSAVGPTPMPTALGALPTLPGELRSAALDETLLASALTDLAPVLPGEARSGVLWSLSGFSPSSRAFIEQSLAGAAPTGTASAAIADLQPGSSVAGVLVNGDLKLAVTGTVTERIGDQILAFGHAFLGQGPLRLPMAGSEVVTVLSSQLSSFKIANVGPVVGSFDLDRNSGVRGHVGTMSETVPMTISLDGFGQAHFEMEVADVPAYQPILVAIAALGTLDSTTRSAGAQGLDLKVRWEFDHYDPLELTQSFDGVGTDFSVATYIFMLTNYLINNPLEEVRLKRVAVEMVQHPEPRTVRILNGFANRAAARPGESIDLTLELLPFRGEVEKETFTIQLPEGLPEGRYSLMVGDGVTMDGLRQAVEQIVPRTFEQSLGMVRKFHSNRDLVVLGLVPKPGLAISGHVLPQLPGSMRGIWDSVAPGTVTRLGLAVAQEIEWRRERPLAGAIRVDLRIERPNRLTPSTETENSEW